MGYKHIQWHDEWLKENYLRYPSYRALCDAHNSLFNTSAKVCACKNHCKLILGLEKPRTDYENWTSEQDSWFKENYPKLGLRETAKEFQKRFGTSKSISSIKNRAVTLGIQVDKSVSAKNKTDYVHTYSIKAIKPVGSQRIECGRLVEKMSDGSWQSALRAEWERHYGKIPDGYIALSLINDPTNTDIENIRIISVQTLGKMARNNWITTDRNHTLCGLTWLELAEVAKAHGIDIGE